MTRTGTAAAPAGAEQAGKQSGLRAVTLAALVMLIVQFGLGIGVNLYVSLPATGKASQAFSNGPTLALHAVLGLLLIVTAIYHLVRAIIARQGPVIVASAVGLLAIIVGALEGFSFVHKGTNAASMGMALATAVALLCYVVSLFLARAPGRGAG